MGNDADTPLDVARTYIECLARGDHRQAASWVLAADREWLRSELIAATEAMAVVGQDCEFLQRMDVASLAALQQLDAEEFTGRFLAIASAMVGSVLVKAQLAVVDRDSATVRYSMTAPGLADKVLARLRGRQRMHLVRDEGRWAVRLERKVPIAQRARSVAESFLQAARGDRATFTPWQELFPIVEDDRWGYMNRKGRVVIQPRFKYAGWFDEGFAPVKLDRNVYRLIDDNGRLQPEPTFSWIDEVVGSFLVIVTEDPEPEGGFLRGLATRDGQVVIPCAYDGIEVLPVEGLVLVRKDWTFGLFDLAGDEVEPLEHDSEIEAMLSWSSGALVLTAESECYPTARNGRLDRRRGTDSDGPSPFFDVDEWAFGYADTDGKIIVAPQFEAIEPFTEGLAAVCQSEQWTYIAPDGSVALTGPFRLAYPFYEGSALVMTQDEYRLIDHDGHRLGGWESAGSFHRGLYRVSDGDEWIGYVDPRGRIVWSGSYDGLGWGLV